MGNAVFVKLKNVEKSGIEAGAKGLQTYWIVPEICWVKENSYWLNS